MCYKLAAPSKEKLKKTFTDKNIYYSEEEREEVSGFTRPYLPVTLNSDASSIIAARWKLAPYWIQNEEAVNKGMNTLNAVGEKIFETRSYKEYIAHNRGLLYVTGFFEPHATDGKKNDETHFIHFPDNEIFTLGITYSLFTNELNQTYPTFTILTTAANDFMKPIHNIGERMPLIIPKDKRDSWLFAPEEKDIKQLIIPFEGQLFNQKVAKVKKLKRLNTITPDIQLGLF